MFHLKSKILYLLLALLALPVFADQDPCEEYQHVNLFVITNHQLTSIVYHLSTNNGEEPPYTDSVWIVNTEQEPMQKLYTQPGDTIDISFLEKQGFYILKVYLNGCMKSRVFEHRVITTDLENTTIPTLPQRRFFYYKGVLCYEAPDGKRYDILGRKL